MKIALFGRSGSGKGVVAQHLSTAHGYHVVSSGALCRAVSRQLFGDEQRSHLNQISAKLREVDEDIWLRAALRGVDAERLVFESVRYTSDIKFLRKEGFVIWRIECSLRVGRERLLSRGQAFENDDLHHASELEMEDFPHDHLIPNEGLSLEDLQKEVDKLVGFR